MEKLLEQLQEILSRECDLHQELIQTAISFNDAIRLDNLEAIQQHTARHDEQVYQIAKLEEKRIECSANLARLLGIPSDAPKMAILLDKVPAVWNKRLSSVQLRLKQQISELTKINTSNRILLEEALLFVNSNLVMFQQSSTRNYRYGIKGMPASISSGRNLINRVI